jgi:hypothetical protein
MPEATQYSLNMKSSAWQAAYATEINARCAEIKRGWDYYQGKHRRPLKIQSDGYDDNVIVNHIAQFVEDLVGFLLGDGITFDSGGDDQGDPADDQIAAMWRASRGAILQNNLSLAGCIEGHPAVRLVPVEGGLPKISRIKGEHFAAFWDPFDMERVMWYRLQYVSGGQGKRIDYVRGRVTGGEIDHAAPGWTEIVYTMKNAGQMAIAPGSNWTQEINPVVWEFDFPPIVDWQNLPNPNGYYGEDDVTGPIHLNDALNFNLSNSQRIIKNYADPKTILTGATTDDINRQPGGLISVPQPEARVYNLEMNSDGAFIQWLAGVITAGLWGAGGMIDPQSIKDRVGDLTNFGLRVLYNRAIKKTEKKRLLYAEAFDQIAKRGLAIAGATPPETVATIWPDVLPEDETVEVATLMQELQAGIIGKETYRERRDYDNDREVDRLAGEAMTGDVGANILGMLTTNKAFNKGASAAGEAAPSNLESTKGLNGAQITAALDIIEKLQLGTITVVAALELMLALGIDEASANRMINATKNAPVNRSLLTGTGNGPFNRGG